MSNQLDARQLRARRTLPISCLPSWVKSAEIPTFQTDVYPHKTWPWSVSRTALSPRVLSPATRYAIPGDDLAIPQTHSPSAELMNFDEPTLRQHIAQNLNVAGDSIAFLRGFENIVFRQCFAAGAPTDNIGQPAARILRLTEPSHRSRAQLQAESAWVLDLAARGVPVARPLPWREDDLIEELVVDDVTYWAMAFELAPG